MAYSESQAVLPKNSYTMSASKTLHTVLDSIR